MVKFQKTGRFQYGILAPCNVHNEELLKEGEGVLSEVKEGEKRNIQDFALWKKSKPGEPKW